MNIKQATKRELRELLEKIANPKSVLIAPDLSDPNYRYDLQDDGTIEQKRKVYLSNGSLV